VRVEEVTGIPGAPASREPLRFVGHARRADTASEVLAVRDVRRRVRVSSRMRPMESAISRGANLGENSSLLSESHRTASVI
jgi:hypothetical protein